MTDFAITRDNSGAVAYGLKFCDNNQYVLLQAATEITLTAPTTSNYSNFEVVFGFTPGSTVWVSTGSVAITAPTLNTFNATAAQMNPSVRVIPKGTVLRFYTDDTGVGVGVSFYGIA